MMNEASKGDDPNTINQQAARSKYSAMKSKML